MRAKPTSKDVLNRLLGEQGKPSSQVTEPTNTEIKSKVMISVPISNIDTYEKNPRREQNPNFYKIKESISKDGVNQPLVISQRPGNSRFTIFKGGNTRLAALRELFSETGDRRFEFVDCCFLPWTGHESDAIIGHLQENQMRKSLCFIDRAFGVTSALEQLKTELAQPNLTLKECHSLLNKKGYCTTLSTLSTMKYATDYIETTLPYEISKTMGRPQVQRIRNLDRRSRKVTKELGITKKTHQSLVRDSLSACGEHSWSHKIFRRELESQISMHADTSIQDISLRIDGYVHLGDEPLCPIPTIKFENSENWSDEDSTDSCTETEPKSRFYSVKTESAPTPLHQNGATALFDESQERPKSISSSGSLDKQHFKQSVQPITDPILNVDAAIATTVLEHRRQTFSSAWTIAKQFGFHSNSMTKQRIVANLGNWGIGYMVTDFPSKQDKILKSNVDLRDNLWWLIFELSDIHWAMKSARALTAKVAVNGNLVDYIRTGDRNVLYRTARRHISHPYPLIGGLSLCARRLERSLWEEVRMLIESYRSLHQLAKRENINLFQQPTIGVKATR